MRFPPYFAHLHKQAPLASVKRVDAECNGGVCLPVQLSLWHGLHWQALEGVCCGRG